MKIGIHIEPHVGYSYDEIVALTTKAEKEGFHQFSVSDHFFGNPQRTGRRCYEAWTILALLTPQTRNIRLGTMVTNHSYRNPAYLAKIVSNLDNSSNGRIDFGIGAGWKESEYKAYGYEFPKARTRIHQLREALEILELMWTETRPPFEGTYYSIDNAICLPKPVQEPRVPIRIGTMTLKAPMMENTIAKYADGIDFEGASPEKIKQKKERMNNALAKVGRDPGDLSWSTDMTTFVPAKSEEEYEKKVDSLLRQIPVKHHDHFRRDLQSSLSGTPETMVERIKAYDDAGIDQVSICLPWIGDILNNGKRAIEIIKDSVLPLL
ncbi:MAG: LLM class flavin-dependent oxidoreductase [Candidatus Lokiarchaeota archaeon]|nr:LLM class flavin-dependent oxidoreductase [Candidatus Lokiarchaeota archaeon]